MSAPLQLGTVVRTTHRDWAGVYTVTDHSAYDDNYLLARGAVTGLACGDGDVWFHARYVVPVEPLVVIPIAGPLHGPDEVTGGWTHCGNELCARDEGGCACPCCARRSTKYRGES